MAQSEELVSLREFARRIGVSNAAVQKAIASGRIERRADKLIDYTSQSKCFREFRDPSKVRDNAPEDDAEIEAEGDEDPAARGAFLIAKTRKETALAGIKEHDLAVLHGEFVRVSYVQNAIAEHAIEVRDDVMTIANRVSSELAAELAKICGIDPEVAKSIVDRIWRRESRLVLEKIANVNGKFRELSG